MHGFRLVCLIVFYATFSSTAILLPHAATVLPVSTPPDVEDIKVGALPNLPDPNFEYTATYRAEAIATLASIMACVAANRELAMMGFDDPVNTAQTWTHPEYPGVALGFAEDNRKPVMVRWAMFLVYAAIKDMMLRHRYQASVFSGFYRNGPIGRVLFHPVQQPANLQQPGPTTVANATKDTNGLRFNVRLSARRTNPSPNEELQARVEYLDKAMDRRDALLTIIYLLISLGDRHNAQLQAYHCALTAITTKVNTIWNKIPSPGARHTLRSG
ncbi:MAG: hypothetical protein Q9184_006284 [Pyrenodesmia sp. 2 TL-2023]